MKKSRKQEAIDSVVQALTQYKKPEEALELKVLCMIARVSPTEAFRAINHLINAGFNIKLTDGFPRKFYCDDG